MHPGKPFSCFDARFLAKVLAASLVVVGIAFVAKQFERGSVTRISLVGAETVVIAYLIGLTTLTVRRLDEMNQRIHLVAIAVSFTITAAVGTALSLLERAGLPLEGWERMLWVFMVLVWGLGVLVIQRRYR